MAKTIRVLIGNLPGVLAEVVSRLLESEADIEVVGRSRDDSTLLDDARGSRPHVVILSLADAELPRVGEALLSNEPRLRVLGVVADDGRGFLYEMRPHRSPLGDLSPSALVTALRSAAATDWR
jgi:DNA-binding NarL/FixJ family response regulator